jgi:hypothetical protein
MTDNPFDAREIVQALNSICAELKALNRTLAQSVGGAQGVSAERGGKYSASVDQAPSYSRPRLTGAAGRIQGKKARADRLSKGGKTRATAVSASSRKTK